MNHLEVMTEMNPISAVSVAQPHCYTADDLMGILDVGRKAIDALIHKKAFPAIRIMSVG